MSPCKAETKFITNQRLLAFKKKESFEIKNVGRFRISTSK